MGRHGYTMDCGLGETWDYVQWRGRVASSIKGARGQKMLRELLEALDNMKDKRLIKDDLITEHGDCCAIGALLLEKEVPDARKYHEHNEALADELDVAEPLVAEIEFMNDEAGLRVETPEERWTRMRAWVAKQIKETE